MDADGCLKTAENVSPSAKEEVEDVPDPDEDDLDDLDDMLDEFSSTKIEESPLVPPIPTIPTASTEASTSDDAGANTFAKELQDQMAAFMGGMEESPEMRQELESMMKDLGAAANPGIASEMSSTPKAYIKSSTSEEPFQQTIRKTMERMQASGEQAGAAALAEGSDDLLAQMLKDMQNGGLPGEGNEEGFNKMLLGMMEQLTNKDILYDPMKELHDKFPPWMEKNRANTKIEDLKRFEDQQKLVGEIVGRFEEEQYSDSKTDDREFIVDRMQRMQAAGSPPADLVGDMNAAEAIDDMDTSCPQQ